MEYAIQMIAGMAFVILSASYLLKPADWLSWVDHLKTKGRRGSLSIGMIAILLGAFIVSFHPVWQGLPLILTLLGVVTLFKGAMMVIFPGWLPAQLERSASHLGLFLRIKALVMLALGIALLVQVQPDW